MIRVRETLDLKLWLSLHDKIFKADGFEAHEIEFYWIAYVDNEPAGFCSMALFKENEGWGYFTRAGVLPKYRGLNIHNKMITVRKRCAKKIGLEGVVTYAHAKNMASIRHLIKGSFKPYVPANPWITDPRSEFMYFLLTF